MSGVFERVQKIAVDLLGVNAAKVTPEASWIDDLGADSLDAVEVVMEVEEEFGCEITDADADAFLTVGDLVKYLEGRGLTA